MKREQIRPGTLCKHFRGKLYQIIGIATEFETEETVVVYQELYGKYQLYVRPISSFVSKVDRMKYPGFKQNECFKLIDKESLGRTKDIQDSQNSDIQMEEIKFENVKKEEYQRRVDEQKSEGVVNPHLLAFVEAENYEEKLSVLVAARTDIDDKLINGMAVSLDVVIPEGKIKDRFIGLKNCLETFRKYECNRFSR